MTACTSPIQAQVPQYWLGMEWVVDLGRDGRRDEYDQNKIHEILK